MAAQAAMLADKHVPLLIRKAAKSCQFKHGTLQRARLLKHLTKTSLCQALWLLLVGRIASLPHAAVCRAAVQLYGDDPELVIDDEDENKPTTSDE